MRRHVLTFLVVAAVSATSFALPPAEQGRGFRDGANHHLGDDSFVVNHGRKPGPDDSEKTRMHEHLVYVHDLLAQQPATRPELTRRRAELLGYLDEYIAAGTTPVNTYVPWRSPVFIDASGNICAVGYLIERSAGRPLAETIARHHRLWFLEDIAGAMPEVRAWIDGSGFTLDELASIQPGYEGPDVQFLDGFGTKIVKDGPFSVAKDGITITGSFAKKKMQGTWTAVDANKKTVGTGTFKDGSGPWKSSYADGKVLAEGQYLNNRAMGTWKFYHPNGKVAAEGTFTKGVRDGAWRFYHDDAKQTPIATGSFAKGYVTGAWKHFDADGKLLATASAAPKRSTTDYYNAGLYLSVTPGKDGVTHEMHGGIPAESYRLDGWYKDDERIYIREDGTMYDALGEKLTLAGTAYQAADCKWSTKRKTAAQAGDIVTVSILFINERGDSDSVTEKCGAAKPVSAARNKKLAALVAATTTVRAPTPGFVKAHMTAPADADVADADESTVKRNSDDLAVVLADSMRWYMEWPHVDGAFRAAYATMPGYNRERYEYTEDE